MKVLYHASANKGLTKLKPSRTLSKDKYIGDFVFATADKMLATMYLAPKGIGLIMDSELKPPKIMICADEAEYKSKDKGGVIYAVDASSFVESPQKELSAYEFVSNQVVQPISSEAYESSLDAMKKAGIKIEFIDQKTFDSLTN